MRTAWLGGGSAALAVAALLAWQYAAVARRTAPAPASPPPGTRPEIAALPLSHALAADHGITVQGGPTTSAWAGWRVRDHLSAHHVLIVRVETDRLQESLAVAKLLVEPVKTRYAEALVYFYRPGGTRLVKRVQWTPRAGYVETDY
jgi:hypothetical protein